ncbi:hypothetical protein N8D74_00730 [Curtobacterium flaccumfaciens]|uniref:Uncharacterized protein n=1 Tax=Curtobacterium poinsettiae TaxID=159612 RepID=A0A9Q9P821_9MICO|nr:hypothetical protein [Curtobacterium flaccumfaciens]UXN25452.1 hypothetical protein N8D74_00730 [Curtobacterium flaccumfaciens]UYC80290.1 hypothetical protein OE229_14300 [Curtobacterium flaccumfaciens pv. poinsettiae]
MPGSRRAAAQRARTVLVTGVAGGTGTTTVAALLADAIGGRLDVVVQATDHSGGELAARLPTLQPATSRVTVHDMGAHVDPAVVLAATPENSLVVVGRATADGAAEVRAALASIAEAPDPALVGRSVVVLVDRGVTRDPVDTRQLDDTGVAAVLVLRADRALSRPGRIQVGAISDTTIATVSGLLTALGW